MPERVLTPDSSKRLHIHAVPSSSMPARPSLDTSLEDPRALLRAASRGLSYWVLTPMQPAHGAVVRSDRDLLSVQIAFKVFEGPDYCQQLLAGRAIPLFAPFQ